MSEKLVDNLVGGALLTFIAIVVLGIVLPGTLLLAVAIWTILFDMLGFA